MLINEIVFSVNDLTEEQILKVFESIINPNILLEDVPPAAANELKKSVNDTLQDLLKLPAQAVENFDQKFDQLVQKIFAKSFSPKTRYTINQYIKKFRQFAEKHPKLQAVILGAVAVILTLPLGIIGGAIVTGFLAAFESLVLGKKLSQSVKTGSEVGALSWGFGALLNFASSTELVKSALHWGEHSAIDYGAEILGKSGEQIGKVGAGIAKKVAPTAAKLARKVAYTAPGAAASAV